MTVVAVEASGPPLAGLEITGEPTTVYRFYSAAGTLLYVGITNNLLSRWAAHAADKTWWHRVARKTVVMYRCREDAEAAEKAAIRTEKPVHNVMGRNEPKPKPRKPALKPPTRQERLAALTWKPRPCTFTLDASLLTHLDAYAERFGCDRDSAFGVLLLTGVLVYQEESQLPLEEELARGEDRLKAADERKAAGVLPPRELIPA